MTEPTAPEPRYASLADLLSPAAADAAALEEDFQLPSGLVVRIRPLTRAEVFTFSGKNMPPDQQEVRMLSKALVLPRMSEADVRKWQSTAVAGELQGLTEYCQEISGMSRKGEKAAAREFPDGGE